MSVVGGPVVRRIIEASVGDVAPEELLRSVGLDPGVPVSEWNREAIDEATYYDLLERVTSMDDDGLPYRYAALLRLDDFGALGLAIKTASTVRDGLRRLVRYILVLSDTLEYELVDEVGGARFSLKRPGHRRGARLANECALAAVTALLRQAAGSRVTPTTVLFRHAQHESVDSHAAFYGCPVKFRAPDNSIRLDDEALGARMRLADAGLSAFILQRLDEIKGEQADRPLDARVHTVVTDSLPDGRPLKSQIARRLGMSERTLHRRLAETGQTFQGITNRAQREAAESLLAGGSTSLAEVAFLTGFSDQTSFSRAFKGWTGQTPLRFRESASA